MAKYKLSLLKRVFILNVESKYAYTIFNPNTLSAWICISLDVPFSWIRDILLHEFAHILLFEKTKDFIFARIVVNSRRTYEILGNFLYNLINVSISLANIFRMLGDIILVLFIKTLGDREFIDAHLRMFEEDLHNALSCLAVIKEGRISQEVLRETYELMLQLPILLTIFLAFPTFKINLLNGTKRLLKEAFEIVLNAFRKITKRISQEKLLWFTDQMINGVSESLWEGREFIRKRKWKDLLILLFSHIFNNTLGLRKEGYELTFETSQVYTPIKPIPWSIIKVKEL